VVVLARTPIKHTAVAGLADFPFELELEVAELLAGHEIIDGAFLDERAVDDEEHDALMAGAGAAVETGTLKRT